MINARDALPEGGHIGIRTFSTDASQHPELAAGRYIGLCVSDDGTGIDPAVLDKVFDPFFTTKPQAAAPAWDCRASTVSPCSRAATRTFAAPWASVRT